MYSNSNKSHAYNWSVKIISRRAQILERLVRSADSTSLLALGSTPLTSTLFSLLNLSVEFVLRSLANIAEVRIENICHLYGRANIQVAKRELFRLRDNEHNLENIKYDSII